MLDMIWLIPALLFTGVIIIAYLLGIEVGRQQAERWSRLRHPSGNWTYDNDSDREGE